MAISWRGTPRATLAGFDDWCLQFGQLLRNDYLSALERLVKRLTIKRGQYANAVQMSPAMAGN